MTELTVKGTVLKVNNLTISNMMINDESNRAFCALLVDELGTSIRVSKIEESKGKRTRNLYIIERQ